MNPGTLVIGYCRLSKVEADRNGHSLDAQENAIRDACKARGWTLLDVIRDEGYSGRDTDRPGLRRALEAVAAGKASGIVAAKLDRLSRSVVDFGTLLDWADQAGATLVALDLGVDTSTPGGRLVANVLASVAQWERETIQQRTRDGLAAARAGGQSISRPAVADDPALQRRIRRLRENGRTLQQVADHLNRQGVPTKRGAAKWTTSSVHTALGYRRPAKRRSSDLPPLPSRTRRAK